MRVRTKKNTESKQEEYFQNLVAEGVRPPNKAMHGITKEQVRTALQFINKATDDLVDVVYALLDDGFPNLFNSDLPFSMGASTAHIGCYVGIFVRNGKKLDREGRDYWIKPLREVGAIEVVTYDKPSNSFVSGHLKAKSPNSAYRIDPEFIKVILASSPTAYESYFSTNALGKRLMLQSQAVEYSVTTHGRGDHYNLIQMAIKFYVPQFLPGFQVIYIDDSDGDRISAQDREKLASHGITLTLNDSFPDIILRNDVGDLWFVESVVSDGEVDETKIANLLSFCKRNKKQLVGATTCYLNWKALAARQDRHNNLAVNSHFWLASDPGKQYFVAPIKSVK